MKSKNSTQLGPLQQGVLDYIWEHEGCTVRQCLDHFNQVEGKDYAYTTIQTIFDVLHRKKLVGRRRRKNAFHYIAKQTRSGMLAARLRELFSRFGIAPQPVASSLVDALEEGGEGELEALIDELKSRGHVE